MKKHLLALLLAMMVVPVIHAKITKHEETVYVSEPGMEAKKIITDTDWKRDGSGDWLHPNHMISFRTTDGRWADIRVDKALSTFTNCKLVYSSVHASSDGEWSGSGILIEAIEGDKPWNYRIIWNINRQPK